MVWHMSDDGAGSFSLRKDDHIYYVFQSGQAPPSMVWPSSEPAGPWIWCYVRRKKNVEFEVEAFGEASTHDEAIQGANKWQDRLDGHTAGSN